MNNIPARRRVPNPAAKEDRQPFDPCRLRCSMEALITQLFALPPAQEGVTEDVHRTIGLW